MHNLRPCHRSVVELKSGLPALERPLPVTPFIRLSFKTLMPESTQQTEPRSVPHPAEGFGNVPKDAESFRTVPHSSESFGTVPQASESFRDRLTVRHENCTLTVREVARMFEAAGVARSERSITNWCQPNRQGIARLEAYFDPNERRYFITPQSVEAVIAEEKAKAAKANAEPLPHLSEEFRTDTPKGSEAFRTDPKPTESTPTKSSVQDDANELAELKKENRDLQIANRGKDYFIEQLQKEREGLLKHAMDASHRLGQLETELLQLSSPAEVVRKVKANIDTNL